jgi:ribonuclease Z
MAPVRVAFLGTGSIADMTRRCASTAVVLPGGDVILVDTGAGQEAMFGLRTLGIDPCRVRAIVLTHQHLDHAGGLPFVVTGIRFMSLAPGAHRGRIEICVPAPALDGLRGVCETLYPGIFNPWCLGDRATWHGCDPWQYLWGLDLREDGTAARATDLAPTGPAEPRPGAIATIVTMAVAHASPPLPSLAVRIDVAMPDGTMRRIVFSGDTGPNLDLGKVGPEPDLLVHEASSVEAVGFDADATVTIGHTSAATAARVATRAKAKRLALHHLGSGWSGNPQGAHAEAARHFVGEIVVPNDLDVVEV